MLPDFGIRFGIKMVILKIISRSLIKVYDSISKVRDLMDSLYQGYPIGYVIAWRNPSVRLKDGSLSEGKKILIDGQQRITALTAAILGQYLINKTYESIKL